MAPLEANTAKAMALLTRERSPLFPDIPTSERTGTGRSRVLFLERLLLSPRTRRTRSSRSCYDATTQTLNSTGDPGAAEKGRRELIAPERRSPAYLKTFVDTEIANWAAMIKASGVSLD